MTTLLLALALFFGTQDTIGQIDKTVALIDNNTTLLVKEFDTAEIYPQAYDGGGSITVHADQHELKKISQVIYLSFGRITTTIYFDGDQPIKIMEREENFEWNEDLLDWDFSVLNQVFQTDIYVFDWEMEQSESITQGKRNLSEGSCAVFDYEPLVELGKRLVNDR